METIGRHAVVLGGSMAGLLAARSLLGRFDRVTLVERDRFPAVGEHRKGVPQARHSHGLLASGSAAIERMFPGARDELVALGAMSGDLGRDGRFVVGGVRILDGETGEVSISVSRPLLEGYLRRRLLEFPTLRALDSCDALGLEMEKDRVRGVRVLRRADGSAEERLPADLVVDATGRGSRAPVWLRAAGFDPPEEERVEIGVGYTTVICRRKTEHLGGQRVVVIGAAPPNRRCGVAVALEGDRWMVTLVGYLGDHAPVTREGLIDFARTLPAPDLYELLSCVEMIEEPVTARFPHSQRRRYERLTRFPEGLIVSGDALCSFNPIFGQGMSVAALEAEKLGMAIDEGPREVWRRFFPAAARIVDAPWSMAVGNDLHFDEVTGKRTLAGRFVRAYLSRFVRAASVDSVAATAFLRVTHLLSPPGSLFAPRLAWRAFAH
jgi:2-polyprenyl-6-methoxyphenol hydroxylase-like FAD-dependent oxidoreductase